MTVRARVNEHYYYRTPVLVGGGVGAIGGVGDPDFNNVVLLSSFEGADGSTSAITDDSWWPKSILFTGSAIVSTSNPKFDSSAIAPSPAGGAVPQGYAYCADSADWQFPGEFTIECWFYPGGTATFGFDFLQQGVSSGTYSWKLRYVLTSTQNQVALILSTDGTTQSTVISAVNDWSPTEWVHIAATRDASNLVRVFRDGVLVASGTVSGALFNSTSDMRIGHSPVGNIPAGCRIDEVRITKGVCRYTADFTPRTTRFPRIPFAAPANLTLPVITGTANRGQSISASSGTWTTAPTYAYQWQRDGVDISGATSSLYWLTAADVGTTVTVNVTATNSAGSATKASAGIGPIAATDPHFANVVLLTAFDGTNGDTTTTDDSPTTPHTLTFNGGSSISTAQSKFGGSSLVLDGSTGYLTIPTNTDFDLSATAAQSFTIEMWLRRDRNGTSEVPIANFTATSGGLWYLILTVPNELLFTYYDGTAFHDATSTGAAVAATGTWMHLAVSGSLSGGTMTTRAYLDGVYRGKVAYTLAGTNNSTLNIGRRPSGPDRYFDGYIDELRFTKGVARYTTETAFAVPTEGYPRS